MLLEHVRQPGQLPLLVGHRGACDVAPENTMASFQRALDDGAEIVEMDIRLSADGQVVVMHDNNVERTTNGTGLVSEMTISEIKRLDAGTWFASSYAGEQVPLLSEVCEWARGKIGMMLEFKFSPFGAYDPALVPAAIAILRDQAVVDQFVAISYQPKAMQQLKTFLPQVRAAVMSPPKRWLPLTSWLARTFPSLNQWKAVRGLLLHPLFLAHQCGVDMVGPNIRLVSPALVSAAHQAGYPVSSGGLKWNYPQAIAMGVDTISSNDPGLVKKQYLTQNQL